MRYCARCLYPENAKPAIIFDDDGICSGCRYHESRQTINWKEREKQLKEILAEYKRIAHKKNNPYDCIVPVSGGKDSHYQVWLLKEVYGINPLLVTFNHGFNSKLGIENLRNLVNKSGCDLIRFTANPKSVKKISRYMLGKVGDLTWHYHAGIRTLPFQIAVKYKIPLIVWGEHGFAELTGMFTLEDMVEFTKWTRQEHDMRGYEPKDLISKESGIEEKDIVPYVYPADEEIEGLGIRGIYLSNFLYWNAKEHADLMINKWGFKSFDRPRERTFVLYTKTDDHANDVHDYLKYLKFGYGRTTDDASMEIRHGRMTREEGIQLVKKYDHVRPKTLDIYLKFLEMTEQEFYQAIELQRDSSIWRKNRNEEWRILDSVVNHIDDPGVERARVPQVKDRTFRPQNVHLYHNPLRKKKGQKKPIDKTDDNFIVL